MESVATNIAPDAAPACGRPSRLLVFADDWGRHPSSCQHLVRELLPEFPVLWVNTIGTRKPRLDLATVRRGLEKVRSWRRPREALPSAPVARPANLTVLDPWMWPYFTRRHDRWLNRRLLTRAIAPLLAGDEPVTAITTLPITADLVGRLPVARWIYYCVDNFSQWPGLDGRTLEGMERELVARVDAIVAAGRVLQARMEALGRTAHLLTHGVDIAHFAAACALDGAALWPELERPLVVFWGLIDRRLDLAWLEKLSQALTRGTILLVGPTQDPDPRLAQLPRVCLRPALPYAELPQLAAAASVLVMPYADLPVTRAMQPLKLLEYLATGRPVVVRDLPAVAEWRDALDACASAEAFAAAVLERLESGLPAAQQSARARLAEESWSAKARQFQAML